MGRITSFRVAAIVLYRFRVQGFGFSVYGVSLASAYLQGCI